MKSVLINADDFGLTEGICKSVATLFDLGAISNTTVMIGVERASARLKNFLSLEYRRYVGVHLQLTPEMSHGKPVSPPKEIPTLVDRGGNFKPKGHTDWINPAEVELEWGRQIIKTAEALGHAPSHLDSHHGVHRNPDLTPIYLKLASKYKLCVRGGKTLNQIDGKPYGVVSSALCTSDWTGKGGSVESFQHMVLQTLLTVTEGVLEICTHPGFCDDELLASSSWNTVRENDHLALCSLAKQRWLESQGITLTRFQHRADM